MKNTLSQVELLEALSLQSECAVRCHGDDYGQHVCKLAVEEIQRLQRLIDEFWEHLLDTYVVDSREEIEKEALEDWNPSNPLVVALHHIWKREPIVVNVVAENEKLKTLVINSRLPLYGTGKVSDIKERLVADEAKLRKELDKELKEC